MQDHMIFTFKILISHNHSSAISEYTLKKKKRIFISLYDLSRYGIPNVHFSVRFSLFQMICSWHWDCEATHCCIVIHTPWVLCSNNPFKEAEVHS